MDALSGDEILDDSEDSLLLMSGKLADFLEDAAGFSDGAALSLPVTEHSKAAREEHLKTGHAGSGAVSIEQVPS
jgi:hypothetical protein